MKKTLILLAHDDFANSVYNKALIDEIKEEKNITIHNIVDTNIDIKKEQDLVDGYDNLIFQFPMQWYNMPGQLKYWLDKVLCYGYAFGTTFALQNKNMMVVTSTGSPFEHYQSSGLYKYNVDDLLKHFEIMALFLKSHYKGILELHGRHALSEDEQVEYLQRKAKEYKDKIFAL